VGHEEGAPNQTAVGILALAVEYLLVMLVVIQIHRPIEGEHYDLWDLQTGKEKISIIIIVITVKTLLPLFWLSSGNGNDFWFNFSLHEMIRMTRLSYTR